MKNIHTPGPWTTGDSDWRMIVGANSRFNWHGSFPGDPAKSLVGVAYVETSENEAEDLANARLIAEAPAMFALLKHYAYPSGTHPWTADEFAKLPRIAEARELIARVEGGAS